MIFILCIYWGTEYKQLRSIIIIFTGYPEPPSIFYFKSNNSLCFSAYSDPRYPVLSYSVNITTQSDTIMTTLNSSHHCISLPGDLSDSCESFTVSATSSNAIGTSNITFQSGGKCYVRMWYRENSTTTTATTTATATVEYRKYSDNFLRYYPHSPPPPPNILFLGVPCAPRISYINNSICFFPHSTFQYYVDYYDVNVTDVTGLQTSLTGTYNSSQCLPIISESHPNVCRPFHVMITATNAYGTSNVTTYNSTTSNRPEGTGC